MSTQAPQILGFIRHANMNSPANTSFAHQKCDNWTQQVEEIQKSTMKTPATDEIFRLNLNTPLTPQNVINIFGLSTNSSPEQLAKLQRSDLFNSFCIVNQETSFSDKQNENDVLIPGKESIHGREVFTLYDDGNPTMKLFGNSNGKMRYFDAQTGRELFAWLPKDTDVRDINSIRDYSQNYYTANLHNLSKSIIKDILGFYAFSGINISDLKPEERAMISELEQKLRFNNSFNYSGCTQQESRQINTLMLNLLNQTANEISAPYTKVNVNGTTKLLVPSARISLDRAKSDIARFNGCQNEIAARTAYMNETNN